MVVRPRTNITMLLNISAAVRNSMLTMTSFRSKIPNLCSIHGLSQQSCRILDISRLGRFSSQVGPWKSEHRSVSTCLWNDDLSPLIPKATSLSPSPDTLLTKTWRNNIMNRWKHSRHMEVRHENIMPSALPIGRESK